MQVISGIPFFLLLVFAILGLTVFLGFSLYRKLILPIRLLRESGRAHEKTVTRLEIVIWSGYFLAVIYYALVASLPVTLILLALVALAFFNFWRNYFSGIILKFGGQVQAGDSISLPGHSGKILEFGNRALKMINTQGEEMLIPYRLLDTEVKIGQKHQPKILYKTLVLEQTADNPAEVKQKIAKAMHINPWVIISKPVQISLEDQGVRLNFYVLNQDFFEKAKYRLMEDLEG